MQSSPPVPDASQLDAPNALHVLAAALACQCAGAATCYACQQRAYLTRLEPTLWGHAA